MLNNIKITEFKNDNRVTDFFIKNWGCDFIVSKGEKLYGKDLPGFMAVDGDDIVGLLTYYVVNKSCEIVTIDSLIPNQGIGSELIERIINKSKTEGLKRLWLMTTNDNIDAMKFYQKRKFVFAAIHVDQIKKSRELKQSIPEFGSYGIPIRDEIEMEYPL